MLTFWGKVHVRQATCPAIGGRHDEFAAAALEFPSAGKVRDLLQALVQLPTMESRAKLFGHPIHQMLIVFPVGLLAAASAFDLIHRLSDSAAMVSAAYWTLSAGLVGALVAAVTAWPGAELVSRLGVGVADRASLNAPSPLRATVNEP